MVCFGTYLTHAPTPNLTRVQSATEWTASEYILHTCPNLIVPVFKVLQNGLLRYILDTCPNLILPVFKVLQNALLRYIHMSKPNVTRVQSATDWTASVHAWHMPQHNLYPCSKCYRMDCLGTHTCPNLMYNSCSKCTEWTASVHTHVQT